MRDLIGQRWDVPSVRSTDAAAPTEMELFKGGREVKLGRDLRRFFAEVDRRTEAAVRPFYPKSPNGEYPWGYLWAITIPCDGCQSKFPLLG